MTQTWYTGVGGDDTGAVRPALPSAVAATGDVYFGYTSWGAISNVYIMNTNGAGYGYTENYTFDGYHRPVSMTRYMLDPASDTRKTYTTSYEYNGGSQLSKMICPSSQQVSVNHDDKGRMQSLTYNPGDTSGYLTGVSYNIAGQVTGLTMGNGVGETFGYDANRMQLTSQTATKSGGPTNGLMNLTYAYQASAGQMGAGSTAGNAGQLMTISGTINSTTESAAYWYDNLGRLVISNQTTNGSSAQRRFAYDRWGNRTTMWPSVFGGSPIQTVTLEQSGGAPTNRITSVTNNGTPSNYVYDAAGNVTNDGVHTYQYDAENRLASVDNGSTAQYKYDHQNRRVSKIIGSSWTHYVWQGGQVIGEHDATTGYTNPTYQVNSARLDYIYAGNQMISSRERPTSGGSWTTKYYLSDRLSTRLVLDTSANVTGRQGHLPFGEDFGESGTQEKHHLSNYERDSETALDYAISRRHSPNVGRFQSPDPYEASGGAVDPQSWNRYSYVENDPVNFVDPSGMLKALVALIRPNVEGAPAYWVVFPGPPDPDDDGQGGAGSGQTKVGLAQDKLDAIDNALTILAAQLKSGILNQGDCKTKVLDKLATLPGFSIEKFAEFLGKGGTFYDGTTSTAPIAGNLVVPRVVGLPPYAPCTTINCLFKDRTAPDGTTTRLNAATSDVTSTLTIYFNPAAISTANQGENRDNLSLLFHEGVHGFGSSLGSGDYSDSGLQELFFGSVGPTSGNITALIKENCFKDQ